MHKNRSDLSARISGIGCIALIGAMSVGIALSVNNFIKRDKIMEEAFNIGEKIYFKAAGKDRVLNSKEKRKLLDNFGFTNKALNEGDTIYLRNNDDGKENIHFLIRSPGRTYYGNRDEVGEISFKQAEDYLKR